ILHALIALFNLVHHSTQTQTKKAQMLVHVDLGPLVLPLMAEMYRLHLVFIEMELAVALVTR
ncbi:hypothetical protein A2U01_0027457, partial [Trifolium medium]|nr:hypothetical protein [Trifolium medium]